MSQIPTLAPPPVQSGWTFTQGLLLGQASFVVLCLMFIRYVVFQPAEDVDQEEWQRRRDERRKVCSKGVVGRFTDNSESPAIYECGSTTCSQSNIGKDGI